MYPPPFTDLHSHLVPGVDDGSTSIEESLSCLAGLRAEGVAALVTTPHLLLPRLPVASDLERGRAQHPEELVEQLGYLDEVAAESGDDAGRLVISYQVTLNVGDSEDDARAAFDQYISQYYPELSRAMDLSNWGPVGTPDQIIEWFRMFREAGVDHFFCRFGSLEQVGQVERFARDVLPALRSEQATSPHVR
jgi:hypothetical protein